MENKVKLKILILEDAQDRVEYFLKKFFGHFVDITSSVDKACDLLKCNTYDLICLDHDLKPCHYSDNDNNDDTGVVVGKFLGDNLHLSSKAHVIVHSMNPTGSTNIVKACQMRKPVKIPFSLFDKYINI